MDRELSIYRGQKGIIQWYSAGQTQFVWDVRQDPSVHKVFSSLWNDDNLLVSFDGINLQIPPEITGKYSNPLGTEWLHSDQAPKKVGLGCIQGFVNLETTDENDGCLIAVPKSHLLHSQMCCEFKLKEDKNSGSDWLKLSEPQVKWYEEHKCSPIRVQAPKGSLVLWDSRTIHANSTAQKGRDDPSRWRRVIYVCMTPRKWSSEKELVKKTKYFNEGRMTSHWPHKIKVFPVTPFFRNAKEKDKYASGFERAKVLFKVPVLTDLGKSLAGF